MFDRLWDFLAQMWGHILPWEVVYVYQNAGVLRFGHYQRTAGPGFHWKVPFVDEFNHQNVTMSTMRLPEQTLTTKDDVSVVVTAMVKFRIEDVKPYICDCTDQADVLIDTAMGAILRIVMETNYNDLLTDMPHEKVATAIRRKVNRYGFKIEEVTFTDFGQVPSIRLIQPRGANLAN
jgi:regulator of protease activity HflC (stomatin/prohibitin superfamily)